MTTIVNMSQLRDSLPVEWQATVQQQYDMLLDNQQPLRLALVGAFSVGKSSLLNMLLGEQWLYTAQEEATALPTFLQYAEQTTLQLINNDGTAQDLTREEFNRATTNAPVDASYAWLGLTQDWLKQVIVIDLPGLGSISEKNYSYTVAQIQQADAILYLIAPRGPSIADLEAIKLIHSYGKRLLLLVNRWDDVERAIEIGEKSPDLIQWSAQIAQATHVQQSLITTSSKGLNKDLILDFISQSKNQVQQIRNQRFVAELIPQLKNALGFNQEQQQACSTRTEQQTSELHQQLVEKKQNLIDVKQQVYRQQEQENTALHHNLDQLISQQQRHLEQQLKKIEVSSEKWNTFIQQGSQLLRLQIADSIQAVKELTINLGELNLPEQTILELNLHLPTLEPIDTDQFLEAAQLNQLKQQLAQRLEEQSNQPKIATHLSEDHLDDIEQAISHLMRDRQATLNIPLPQVEELIQDTTVANIGRSIGATIDNLLFFLPGAAIGKVAKVIGLGTKAIKTTQNVHKTINTLQKTVNSVVPLQASGLLSLLSIATWGEKIGGLIDGPPQRIFKPDPEAHAQMQQQIQGINQTIVQLRTDLLKKQELISESRLAGFALEQKQKEVSHLQSKIEKQLHDLQQRELQATHEQQRQQQQQLESYHARAIKQWLNQFQMQTKGIENYLYQYLKGYWENVINAQLKQRIEEIEDIKNTIDQIPEQKAQQLIQLAQEAQQLNNALAILG